MLLQNFHNVRFEDYNSSRNKNLIGNLSQWYKFKKGKYNRLHDNYLGYRTKTCCHDYVS